MKMCSDCGKGEAWRRGRCKPCDYATSKAYEKTPKGYLVRTYRNMTNRVKGILKKKAHLYEGLPICDKEEFYEWSLSEGSGFLSLLQAYKDSDYLLNLAPSVDRKDSSKGYTFGNMEWVAFEDNSSRTKKRKDKSYPAGIHKNRNKFVVSKTLRGKHTYKTFDTLVEAEDFLKRLKEEVSLEDNKKNLK